jgi:hypothetical protein
MNRAGQAKSLPIFAMVWADCYHGIAHWRQGEFARIFSLGVPLLILHIGTHKTGTSALQTFLSRNAEILDAVGARYVQCARGAGKAHHELAWAVRGKHGADMSVWRDLCEELSANASLTNIVSSEGFWFTDPADVKEQLKDIADIRIVMYLRRQDKYLQSLYKQSVTGGRKTEFSAWLKSSGERGNYLAVVERWAEQFGPDAIEIRPYERDSQPIDVVEDFATVAGFDLGAYAKPGKRKKHNPSPRRELLLFIRAFNALDIEVNRDKFFYSLIRKNENYIRSADLLSSEQSIELMDGFIDGNRLLAERYFGGKVIFPEMKPNGGAEIWSQDGGEFFSLTVDVLDTFVKLVAEGEIDPNVKRKPKKRVLKD